MPYLLLVLLSLRLCHFNQFFENFRFMLGKVGEYLAVELYFGFDEAVNELVVGETVEAGGGTNLYLPQSAGVALLFAAVIELEGPGVEQGLLGGAVFSFASPHKTLCMFQQVLAAFICSCSSFNTWHEVPAVSVERLAVS